MPSRQDSPSRRSAFSSTAYERVFVVLSILWGWWMDGVRPDHPEVAGALLCLAGAGVIMYWPRA